MTLRVLRVAHRWLGLLLALPMLVQAVTGCVLVMTPVWLAMQPLPSLSDGPARPASAVLGAAVMPGLVAVRYQPGEARSPAQVDLGRPGERGSQLQVLVDPVSLRVVATRESSAAYRWIHGLHEDLLMPGIGRSVVGWFGAGLLLLGLSGIVLWWPAAARPGRWRAAVTVRQGARGARLQRELHGAAGFWVSVMLVVMSLSGMTLAFPQATRTALGLPAGGGPPRAEERSAREPLDVDAVLVRLAAAMPDARIVDLRLPNAPGRPVLARLERPGARPGAPPIVATVDPAGHRVLSVQDPASPLLALLGWARALHGGDGLGPVWRLLVFLTALGLAVLTVSGTTLWLLRRRNRLRLLSQRRDALAGAAE